MELAGGYLGNAVLFLVRMDRNQLSFERNCVSTDGEGLEVEANAVFIHVRTDKNQNSFEGNSQHTQKNVPDHID